MHQQHDSAAIEILELETVRGGISEQLVDTNKPLPSAWQKYDECLRPFFQQYDAFTLRGREGDQPNWSDVDRCKAELHSDLAASSK